MTEQNKTAQELEDIFNRSSLSNKEVCEWLSTRCHKTIQQNITRFCVAWLNHLATDWTISVDGRNEASVSIAKDLHRIEEAREVLARPIPYI